MNSVMRIIKENNIEIINQKLEIYCEYEISIRKNDVNTILNIFKNLYQLKITQIK